MRLILFLPVFFLLWQFTAAANQFSSPITHKNYVYMKLGHYIEEVDLISISPNGQNFTVKINGKISRVRYDDERLIGTHEVIGGYLVEILGKPGPDTVTEPMGVIEDTTIHLGWSRHFPAQLYAVNPRTGVAVFKNTLKVWHPSQTQLLFTLPLSSPKIQRIWRYSEVDTNSIAGEPSKKMSASELQAMFSEAAEVELDEQLFLSDECGDLL